MNSVRQQLEAMLNNTERGELAYIVAAVTLPTKAVEIITNFDNVFGKLEYYLTAYDENMRLKANPDIVINNVMIGTF
jgi:hypothetical protein